MAMRGVIGGNPKILIGVAAVGLVAIAAFASLPAGERLDNRLESSATDDSRSSLYRIDCPLAGLAGLRVRGTTPVDRQPSVGWHPRSGLAGHVLARNSRSDPLRGVDPGCLAPDAHHRSGVGLAINASMVVVSVEIFYYGFIGMALFLVMIGAAAAWRPDPFDPPNSKQAATLSQPQLA